MQSNVKYVKNQKKPFLLNQGLKYQVKTFECGKFFPTKKVFVRGTSTLISTRKKQFDILGVNLSSKKASGKIDLF